MKRYIKESIDQKVTILPLSRWDNLGTEMEGDAEVTTYSWVEFPYKIDVRKTVERKALDGFDSIYYTATIENMETGRSWNRQSAQEKWLLEDIEKSINV